jgi:EAL domain-containing protein (putative c-di-GMP-specific phosphodiesterase class I)
MRRCVGPSALQSISINVSPSQFAGRNVAYDIIALLAKLDLPPEALTIEVTEELLMEEFTWASAQVQQLASQGVRIALDDFGVGYSNIACLRQFAFHTLKVDRSLILDVATEPKVRSILGAIVALARALELTLVAEGVETEAQSAQLARLGFRRQQGFLHGRPMPAAAFEQAIAASLCRSAIQAVTELPHPAKAALIVQ